MSGTRPRRRWLTLLTLAALAVLISLGVWQVRRLAWKAEVLERVASAPTSALLQVENVAAACSNGRDVEWSRLRVTCRPLASAAPRVVYAVIKGDIAWRGLHPCAVGASGIPLWIDRGVLGVGQGEVSAPAYRLPPPVEVVGLLRSDESLPPLGGPLTGHRLVAQAETPQPAGVRPVPVPPEIANNHLGYAITWFGLAAALAGVYAAVLIGDRRRARAGEGG